MLSRIFNIHCIKIFNNFLRSVLSPIEFYIIKKGGQYPQCCYLLARRSIEREIIFLNCLKRDTTLILYNRKLKT